MKKLYPFIGLFLCCSFSDAQEWSAVSTGVNSSADALNVYGGELVAGGRYSSMTKWDGSTWTDFFESGNPTATTIYVNGLNLYAGGQFTGGEGNKIISHFDGNGWSIVGGDVNAYDLVSWNTNFRWWSIFEYNSDLHGVYDGGLLRFDEGLNEFVQVGNQLADIGSEVTGLRYAGEMSGKNYFSGLSGGIQRIFTWNNVQWDTLDLSGYPLRYISCAEVVNNELFIGGAFQNANSSNFGLLKWNGSGVSEVFGMGPGIPNITKFFRFGIHLYAFYTRDGYNTVGVKNGSGFDDLSGELFVGGGSLNAMAEYNNSIFAGGFFTTFDGVTVNNIAQREGSVSVSELQTESAGILFPNPATWYVDISAEKVDRAVSIADSRGQHCLSMNLAAGETRIVLADLSPGLYLITIGGSNSLQTRRILIQ
jgi:hypothetical protein